MFLTFSAKGTEAISQKQQAHLLPRSWLLVSPSIKGIGLLRKVTDSRTGAGNIEDDPWAFCSSRK